ncbi:hypothetical protein MWU53_15810 [Aliiroseovarius sp. S1123]|uniref:hypothetical protein n=1 Tax=Rhodobacterales TaxID=204455 RepID=UPI001FF4C61F|nr:hypothetical protein [Aliiroseovarius sp. S1123]MCK0172527.1 hypothetical protein [Aliiroseovarius sp. S1123]
MRTPAVIMLSAAITLTGCVAQETFVKNKMRYSDYELDRAQCETKSSQEIAVNRSPGAEIAVALLTGAYSVQDANATARMRNYEACMISKGYQRVELPPCKNANEARVNGVGPLNASNRVTISSNSCATNDNAGRIIFYQQ